MKSGERRGECIVAVAARFEHQIVYTLAFLLLPRSSHATAIALHTDVRKQYCNTNNPKSLSHGGSAHCRRPDAHAARTTEQQTSPKEHKTNKSNCAFFIAGWGTPTSLVGVELANNASGAL